MEDVDHFAHFYFDKTRRSYIMKAYKQFHADEQVFITYGNYNNAHFIEYYGFIPS